MHEEGKVYIRFTADELEKMITAHIRYWTHPGDKSDIEAEAARALTRNCFYIAMQLLSMLKEK